jgi:hypothetical protein
MVDRIAVSRKARLDISNLFIVRHGRSEWNGQKWFRGKYLYEIVPGKSSRINAIRLDNGHRH